MFSEVWQFAKVVISFWAEWSTGGVLVLAILLARLLKSNDFRKGTQWFFLIFFLLMGFFSAWEEQKQSRITAENDRDFYKSESVYKQKRIDVLSDAQLKQPSHQASISVTASNISGIGSVSGSGNNIAFGGNNQFGDGNVQYNGPPPLIVERLVRSLNTAKDGYFETLIELKIANAENSKLNILRTNGLVAIELIGKGAEFYSRGYGGYCYIIQVDTSTQWSDEDFKFKIEKVDNQRLAPVQK
jgi:hypothetical protein